MILEDGQDVPEWVIGSWHCYFHLELHAVCRVDGKPRPDYHATSNLVDMYTWLSYHAARKFQRAHPELEGYIIFNLGEARKQCWTERKIREERLEKERADLLREQPPPGR